MADPEPTPEAPVQPSAPVPTTHYVAGRPMQRDGHKIKVGDELPDAGEWFRLESWIRTGYVKEVAS